MSQFSRPAGDRKRHEARTPSHARSCSIRGWVLNGPTRLRFELVRAGASPIQARSASKWNPAFWSLLRRGEAAYGVRELVTAFWPTAARKHPSSRVPDLPTPIRDLRRLVSSTFVVPPSAGFSSSIAQDKNHERHESHEKQSGYRTEGRRGNGDVPCNDECRKSNDERSPKSQIDASPSALAPFRSQLPASNSQLPFPPARPDLPSPNFQLRSPSFQPRSSPEGSRPSAPISDLRTPIPPSASARPDLPSPISHLRFPPPRQRVPISHLRSPISELRFPSAPARH